MKKTNFTKVEEALAEEMRRLAIQKIIGTTQGTAEEEYHASQKIIKQLVREINAWIKKDKQIFDKLGFKKEQIKTILEQDSFRIGAKDWKVLMQFKERLEGYRATRKKEAPGDEDLVDDERRKHINKRFNINDEWLPLQ